MWPYWLLFLVPAYQAVSRLRLQPSSFPGKSWPELWRVMFVLIALMIGLRHEVGGDWYTYLANMMATTDLTLEQALTGSRRDPADSFLNWVAAQSSFGIYLINCIHGTIFASGLLIFCRRQPRPWLAVTVAVPYLITVVAMGYSRQGVAIGLVMLGLVALEDKKVFKFLLWIALAAAFHKSAVILVPLAMLAGTRRRWLTLFWVGMTAVLLFGLLLKEYVDSLIGGYINTQYESSGAAIRITMNALPAALFLLLRKRFHLTPAQRTFWTWMALGGLAFVVLLYISPSSTAVDRVALYWIPMQIFVWSRVPDAIGRTGATTAGWVYAVVAYSATVHFVWLFFADNADSWLPYQFYPWVWLWQ
jgi:hypothetical protein